jgi:hypothetical protein
LSASRNPLSDHVADPLPRLRERLADEYGGSVSTETIDRAAVEALDDLSSARVRDFVPVFAWRRARARLRRSTT